jgi:plastocyanin
MTTLSYRSLAFAVALGLILFGLIAAADVPTSSSHTVTIEGAGFQPKVLTVKVGDSVMWVNKDPFPHTVTSRAGDFDSGEIQPGKSWTYTAETKGTFPYICTLHPTMKAMLRVQ